MARRVIDHNHYMVLGTRDPDGSPRLSPVFSVSCKGAGKYRAAVGRNALPFLRRG